MCRNHLVIGCETENVWWRSKYGYQNHRVVRTKRQAMRIMRAVGGEIALMRWKSVRNGKKVKRTFYKSVYDTGKPIDHTSCYLHQTEEHNACPII